MRHSTHLSMKYLFIVLILIIGSMPLVLDAQRPTLGTGIKGEPNEGDPDVVFPGGPRSSANCPTNTRLGSTVNVWDWRQDRFTIYLEGGRTVRPYSPFILANHQIPWNTSYLVFPQDYQPSDGWELLYREFGTPGDGVPVGSFGLYNRFTGTVRALFYLTNDEEKWNFVDLTARFLDDDVLDKGAAILDFADFPIDAIENTSPTAGKGFTHPNLSIKTDQGFWGVIEFPTLYDPCVCQDFSVLTLAPLFKEIKELSITLEGTSKSTAVYENGSTTNPGFRGLSKAGSALFDGIKRYKDWNAFYADGDKGIGFVRDLAPSFLPYVGGIVKLLDGLIGSKSSAPKLTGFNSNYNFTGEIISEQATNGDRMGIITPGSDITGYEEFESLLPVYNNPLGTFNLLETPKVIRLEETWEKGDYQGCDGSVFETQIFKFDASSLKYVVNDIGGLQNQPVELKAALRFSNCYQAYYTSHYQENIGLIANEDNPDVYHTPLLNIDCLDDYVVRMDLEIEQYYNSHFQECEDTESGGSCSEVDLLVVAVLRPVGGTEDDDVVVSLTFNTEIVPATFTLDNAPQNPFDGTEVDEINFSCPGVNVAPLSDSYVEDYCADNYDPTFSVKSGGKSLLEDNMKSLYNYRPVAQLTEDGFNEQIGKISAYPNPTTDALLLDLDLSPQVEKLNASIYDTFGRLISTSTGEPNVFSSKGVNTSGLITGTYILSVSDQNGTLLYKTQFIKQ